MAASVKWYYGWCLALVLSLASLFLAWPCYECFDSEFIAWKVVMLKAEQPLHTLDHIEPQSWLSKKVFRLSVPVLIGLLHLKPFGAMVLQYVVGYLLIHFIYRLSRRVLQDPVSATYLTAGMTFLYFGRTAFVDVQHLWFDAFAYFFLVLAMYARSSWSIFLFATAAAWTDERAFMALGIVHFFHQLAQKNSGPVRMLDLLRPGKNGMFVLLSIAVYLALRGYLTHFHGMSISTYAAEPKYLRITLPYIPIATWTFLEGSWLLYVVAVFSAFRRREHFLLLAFLLVIAAAMLISGSVADLTRSGSYVVPIIFVLIMYLRHMLPAPPLRRLILVAAAISLLFPSTFVCTDWPMYWWFRWPLPVEGARHLLDAIAVRYGAG